jgi:hypothetical protein
MSVGVTNTPYTMTFCISVSGDVNAVPLPTYSSPLPPPQGDGSEAFLGNNGFYTGVPGDPALYTTPEGSTATVSITNIEVKNSAGIPVTGWELATGDAESTDTGESMTWSTGASGPDLNLLPNTPISPVGNDCESVTPTFNTQFLTGVGTSTVECSANSQVDKTGTVMLEALSPSSLTVTMVGAGLQAMFLGLQLT